MNHGRHRRARGLLITAACSAALALSACESTEGTVALGAIGATLIGARTPAHEIEQIYYLGAFDPQEQIPVGMYRIRVHGQASIISGTKFASGWVPAPFIDSLSTHTGFEFGETAAQGVQFNQSGGTDKDRLLANLSTGRRLVQFGPEGFRPVPKDHRLVIVMGSSPEAFFKAMDSALGSISEVRQLQRDAELERLLFEALTQAKTERARLADLQKDTVISFPPPPQ